MSGKPESIRSSRLSCVCWVAAALLCVSVVAEAAPPVMTPSVPTCIPQDGNAVVALALKPETGWSSVRVYFRKSGTPDFYFLEKRSDGRGNYWAVLPRPMDDTTVADLQFAVKDGEGKETRSPVHKVNVTESCSTGLTAEQITYARNLVVGETHVLQAGEALLGWKCIGVVSRIGVSGQMRYDDTCRSQVIAAAAGTIANERLAAWIPAAAAGGAALGGTIIYQREHKDCSKCRVWAP